jgi:hypothetical protein
MRALATCMLVLGLMASPMLTLAAGRGDKDSAKDAAAKTANAADTAPAANPSPANDPAGQPSPSSVEVESELRQMRELLEAQSKQLQEQQQRMNQLEEQLKASEPGLTGESPAAAPVATAASASAAANAVGPVGPVTGAVAAAKPAQEKNPDEPASIHYKGVTITPGGFMAAETVWRQKALSADVNTPFNSAPFNGSSNAHISEFNASGRQSRFSLLTEGKLADVKIGGYYETDFLSAGTTSNDNQSNSYTLRQRQFWGQAAFTNGFTFTGGQQWSLLTETLKGMDNRTEALPQTIDAQYHAGFSWARQYGFRVTKNFGNKMWLGFAVEEAQTTVTVHGNPTVNSGGSVVCTNAACTTTTTINPTVLNNFLVGAFGASGGLYNPLGNYAYNRAPDLVFKAVFEPGFGHYEIFGLLSQFRDRAFPCVPITGTTPPAGCASATSAAGAFSDSRIGGGGGGNARWSFFAKKVDFGLHGFAGTGIGRYGSAGLPDATVRPNGTLAPIRNYQALGTLQFHPTPKLDINLNAGGEYSDRAPFAKGGVFNEGYGAQALSNSGCWTETLPVTGPSTSSNTGVPTGVGGSTGFIPGPLGNCTGDTRNVIEGTIGFWYRFYKGPRGTVQYGMQYSNYIRNTWRGLPGTGVAASGQPHSDENMVFTSFRYYLP